MKLQVFTADEGNQSIFTDIFLLISYNLPFNTNGMPSAWVSANARSRKAIYIIGYFHELSPDLSGHKRAMLLALVLLFNTVKLKFLFGFTSLELSINILEKFFGSNFFETLNIDMGWIVDSS